MSGVDGDRFPARHVMTRTTLLVGGVVLGVAAFFHGGLYQIVAAGSGGSGENRDAEGETGEAYAWRSTSSQAAWRCVPAKVSACIHVSCTARRLSVPQTSSRIAP
jgi:hypothetical protein